MNKTKKKIRTPEEEELFRFHAERARQSPEICRAATPFLWIGEEWNRLEDLGWSSERIQRYMHDAITAKGLRPQVTQFLSMFR